MAAKLKAISEIQTIRAMPRLFPVNNYVPLVQEKLPPSLKHNLHTVFQKSGPHFLKNRDGTFNFSEYLEKIPKVKESQLTNFSQFVRVSDDLILQRQTRKLNLNICSSTSSINNLLLQLYFAISNNRLINRGGYSDEFVNENRRFSPFIYSGTKSSLIYRDGVYCLQSVDSGNSANVLNKLGHVIEAFLVNTPKEFHSLRQGRHKMSSDSYHYAKLGNMLVRAQLDCSNPALPKTTFDLKSRAVLPIRKDLGGYRNNLWYEITKEEGRLESFERERYDMHKAAYLKYSLQARIGNMDGIFVVYHNTDKVFGFEYLPLEKMEAMVYGSQSVAEKYFSVMTQLLSKALEEIIGEFPEQDVQILVNTPSNNTVRIYATGANQAAKDPICLEIQIFSFVNDEYSVKPRVGPDDDWHVHYQINRIEYLASEHEYYENRYRKMFEISNPSGSKFIEKLKAELNL